MPEYLVLTGLHRAIGEDRLIPDSSKVAAHTACRLSSRVDSCHISPLYRFVFPYPKRKFCGMVSSPVHPSSRHLQFGTWSKPEAFETLLYKVLPHPLPVLLERGRWIQEEPGVRHRGAITEGKAKTGALPHACISRYDAHPAN